jgi:hypothetical protein
LIMLFILVMAETMTGDWTWPMAMVVFAVHKFNSFLKYITYNTK